MITNDLQKRIYFGDRDAFLAVYEEYGPGVFAAARRQLATDALADGVVKQTFLTLYRQLQTETEDFDIPVRIRELTERELLLMRLICGEDCALPDVPADDPALTSARGAFLSDEAPPHTLPQLERDRTFRRTKNALFSKKRRQKEQKRRGFALKIFILLLDILLIWALVGVLMALGYLPAVDLGYSWFSRTVLPLIARLS